jgi:putative two-component system response regulator
MHDSLAEKNRRILVVDDDPAIHAFFREALGGSGSADRQDAGRQPPRFQIDTASQGPEAMVCLQRAIAEGRPYAMAFVDIDMPPGWDGITTIGRLWQVDSQLQTVICTGLDDVRLPRILSELGESDRLLMLKKPVDPRELQMTAIALTERWNATHRDRQEIRDLEAWVVDAEGVMRLLRESHEALEKSHTAIQHRATELATLLQQRTAEAISTRDVMVLTLAKLAESRDPETGEHLERIRAYAQVLAGHLSRQGPYTRQIDQQFLEDLYRASPLHDIGKVGIPDEILLKPGPLTAAEFEVMKQHAVIGATTLHDVSGSSDYVGFLAMAVQIARHHHERFDGDGYPDGLAGEEIPLAARIVALADVFDALTSVRIYKDAVDPEITRTLIEEQDGRHFDPAVVEAFRACYPDFLQIWGNSHHKSSNLLESYELE